jgi:hypothetical protein
LVYDGLEVQPAQSLGDLYQGFEKYSIAGLPMPLPDKPLITQMSDTHVTLTWKPGEQSKLVEVPKTFNSIKQKKIPFTIKLLPSKTAIDNVLLFSFISEYVLKQF